jgi:hypothetical protein
MDKIWYAEKTIEKGHFEEADLGKSETLIKSREKIFMCEICFILK